jgi:hypothetical protein
MAGCMATLKPLIERVRIKAQSLRSPGSRAARKWPRVEIRMTSSNEDGGDSRRGHVAQLSRSTGDIQSHDRYLARISQNTSRGSTECILS